MANEENANNNENMKLDDAQRVKVLSPGMLVAKRFFRNKLAIIGMVIIICMFLFSFLVEQLSLTPRARYSTVQTK